MNDLLITVSGWVATEPRFLAGPSGARMTTFRLASTSRYFDRDNVGDMRYLLLRNCVGADPRGTGRSGFGSRYL